MRPGSNGGERVSEEPLQKPLRIAMVAGEPSGDRQGAALLTTLRALVHPRPVEAWGIGGHFLAEAGFRLRHDSDPWAAIGIADTLPKIPGMYLVLWDMMRAISRDPPDALVLIDAGAFNVKLARWVKKHTACPVFYYFPPSSWRKPAPRRTGKSNLATMTDRIVTPFPWSEEGLRRDGADAHFVGHPLLDLVKPTLAEEEFHTRFGLDPHRPLVALLPGSRQGEIRHILPILLGAAGEITRRIPGVQFVLALPSPGVRPLVEKLIRREQRTGGHADRLHVLMTQAGDTLAQIAQSALTPPLPQLATNEGWVLPPDAMPAEARARPAPVPHGPGLAPLVICEGLTWDALARCDLALTKSGTATLEAMILKKPMVIVYRGSWMMALEGRWRWRNLNITHIGMPNIIAGERLFAELLQDEATPQAIADLAVELLLQPDRILVLKERLQDLVRDNLGEPGGVRRAALLLLDLIAARTPGGGSAAPDNQS